MKISLNIIISLFVSLTYAIIIPINQQSHQLLKRAPQLKDSTFTTGAEVPFSSIESSSTQGSSSFTPFPDIPTSTFSSVLPAPSASSASPPPAKSSGMQKSPPISTTPKANAGSN
ncbi:hypothetical protein BATDEDRAFT_92487 [Batrachochytrium dendrobatidis JAM81]|uniref:Uncharacterized protein n=2 Tax=Batrachochytrium dendrobatidis TaxID=109871 RepID=F4PDN4_BATDJ|nr:uncharacterized protein BATDEDRAFT_92487 [Batrachochytrium dendrobatidis JAM81]EGF76710.1 hypothetical protein BATDEDRAFT_92487 [Batrachochytrium dendrobatidis JAM81]KAJ8329432.1 hypothetical protein O5D80_002442 [Batrachochytrium dendrobatidis]KAK5666820.1 hypothetical protein QVD99_006457 [Batrachochytrium dendrobatidis]OAJ45162.1 hypothetical protein BDEG_28323 [Batrachochytrium dendrobatidis JEL423]|eukprot:XP_006682693.1 hypothetical protein BATDEDRAFT_92487 [Batrachochytrium dendrobatidis JAM81]